MEENYISKFVYIPKEDKEPSSINTIIGVRFCQDTFLHKSYLDQHNIIYKSDELEETPFGFALRIKKIKQSDNDNKAC